MEMKSKCRSLHSSAFVIGEVFTTGFVQSTVYCIKLYNYYPRLRRFIARVVRGLRVLSGDWTQNHGNQMAVNGGKLSFFFPCDVHLSG